MSILLIEPDETILLVGNDQGPQGPQGEAGLSGYSTLVQNTDVDTGTQNMDLFSASSGNAAFWEYLVIKTTNVRAGRIFVGWLSDGTLTDVAERKTLDEGDTSDFVLSIDYSGGNIRLRATVASDDWAFSAYRRLL